MTTQPIPVQQSQVMAAKLLLLLEEKYGRPVTPKVRKLARAERSPKGDTPYVIVDPPAETAGPSRRSTDQA